MANVKRLLMVFLILLLASCATPPATPDVKVKGYAPVSGKLPLKVALIIGGLDWKAVETTVVGRCLHFKDHRDNHYSVTTDEMYAKNNIGLGVENLFIQGLPYLFTEVAVYRTESGIKGIENFDLILYPDIEIKTSYDKEGALKREISDLFQIFVEGKLNLEVADVKSGLTYNFAEDFKGIGWAGNRLCSRKRMDNTKDYVLSSDYNKLIELVYKGLCAQQRLQ